MGRLQQIKLNRSKEVVGLAFLIEWPDSPQDSNTYTSSSSSSTVPLKHVTKSNFDSALSELKSHVGAADFVAIDLEMTDVTSAPWLESSEFDRFDVWHFKARDPVENFAIVRLGVCPFRWDDHRHSFIAHLHNFFIFPYRELAACSQHLVVYTDSKNDRDLLMKKVKDDYLKEAEMKIRAAIGFRHVIDLLSSAQKLIVGHNCFLDIPIMHAFQG